MAGYPGRCPGLRDRAPLALQSVADSEDSKPLALQWVLDYSEESTPVALQWVPDYSGESTPVTLNG